MPRESWTDERLDDLNKKVDDGFGRLDGDIRDLRSEVREQGESLRKEIKAQGSELRGEIKAQGDSLRGEVKAQGAELRGEAKAESAELRAAIEAQGQNHRSEMNELRREMNERFDSANRNLVGAVVVIVAAILGSNAF
jgi:predicted  nucleic acid-binding Zn-ribbon protein